MSIGYEVCIHRDGRWEIYSFFDANEESDAIYQARDISNNYNAVCVLGSREMRVFYFKSQNKKHRSPKYLEVKSDLKLGRKKPSPLMKKSQIPAYSKSNTRLPIPTKNKNTSIKLHNRKLEKNEDPFFSAKDKQRAFLYSIITISFGFIVTFFSPSLLSDNAESSMKLLIMGVTLLIFSFIAYIIYQVSEQASRIHNQKQDIDSDEVWRNLGLSDQTLKKLEKKQKPEVTNAISASTISTLQSKEQAPSNVHSVQLNEESEIKKEELETQNNLEKKQEENNVLAEANLRKLLTEMCRAIKKISHNKETHNLAAVLYLCGAASFAVKHFKLSQENIESFVPLFLTRVDIDPVISESYVNKLSNYIISPNHLNIFDVGIADAKLYIDDNTSIFKYEEALNKWLELQRDTTPDSFFSAILFTDIENFTETTRVNGDNWMIDVLHAHNDIIRKVLVQYKGQEIKHTGDGLLATFENVHQSVEAAISIQRSFEHFSHTMPNRQFKTRIAIGAGEIVSIDGDIFGSAVNLTARTMSLAIGAQISINESVHGIIKNNDLNFKDLGEHELKGCEKQKYYLINWE